MPGIDDAKLRAIIYAGVERLRLAENGVDFFQEVPEESPGSDLGAWYLRNFGKVINSDCAKLAFLRDGYIPGNDQSVEKFYPQASQLVQKLIKLLISEYANRNGLLILTAGGNGSGKSTFCSVIRPLLGENDFVIDSTFASYDSAINTIKLAREQGFAPVVIYIKRTPEEAWKNGVLKRAAHGSHRTPRYVFDSTHTLVPQYMDRIAHSGSIPLITIPNPVPDDFIF